MLRSLEDAVDEPSVPRSEPFLRGRCASHSGWAGRGIRKPRRPLAVCRFAGLTRVVSPAPGWHPARHRRGHAQVQGFAITGIAPPGCNPFRFDGTKPSISAGRCAGAKGLGSLPLRSAAGDRRGYPKTCPPGDWDVQRPGLSKPGGCGYLDVCSPVFLAKLVEWDRLAFLRNRPKAMVKHRPRWSANRARRSLYPDCRGANPSALPRISRGERYRKVQEIVYNDGQDGVPGGRGESVDR